MKGKEIINSIVQTKMPDLEQVRENCHRKAVTMPSKRRNAWQLQIASISACIVIVVAAIVVLDGDGILNIPPTIIDGANNPIIDNPVLESRDPSTDYTTPNTPVLQRALGFVIGETSYHSISFEDRKKFGLVEQDAFGLTLENDYIITEADLGERMGIIENSEDEELIGAIVYHFSAFPYSDAICVVRINENMLVPRDVLQLQSGEYRYEFYTMSTKLSSLGGTPMDKILNDYGITEETISEIAVLAANGTTVTTITDNERAMEVIKLMQESGTISIGYAAHEELMLKWLEACNVDDDGAHLLEAGQRAITVTTKSKVDLTIIYHPSIPSFFTHDSYFILNRDSVEIMNELLLIGK